MPKTKDDERTRIGNTPTCEDCGESLDHCECGDECLDCGWDPCVCDDGEGDDDSPSLFALSEPTQENLKPQFDREAWLRTKARQAELVENPALIAEALPRFNFLLDEYHDCICADDWEAAQAVNERADGYAADLQGGDRCGILIPAAEGGAGSLLEEAAAAPDGVIPKWGQCGNFIIQVGLTLVRVEYGGIFDRGFSIHAVKWDRPFPSETGYRSFAGVWPTAVKLNSSVADWVKWNVEEYIKRDYKKGLPFIRFEHQEHHSNSLPIANVSPVAAPPVAVEPIEPPAAPVASVGLFGPARGGSQLSLFGDAA